MAHRRAGAVAPAVLGTAGGGLADSSGWAANADVARIGQAGEVKMAGVLDRLARPGGPAVLHDLRIPIPGFTANIDHVVVSGRRVLILDSKMWKPGFYWTVGGKTRRGAHRFVVASRSGRPAYPAETRTMSMAYDSITRFLRDRGVAATVAQPIVVVFPSSPRTRLRVSLLRFPGARVMTGDSFTRRARGIVGRRAADPMVVAALAELVNAAPPPAAAHRRRERHAPRAAEADPFAPTAPAPGAPAATSYETGGGPTTNPWA